MNRFIAVDWVPKKLNALIQMPDVFDFKDVVFQGLAPNEALMKDAGNQQQNKGVILFSDVYTNNKDFFSQYLATFRCTGSRTADANGIQRKQEQTCAASL